MAPMIYAQHGFVHGHVKIPSVTEFRVSTRPSARAAPSQAFPDRKKVRAARAVQTPQYKLLKVSPIYVKHANFKKRKQITQKIHFFPFSVFSYTTSYSYKIVSVSRFQYFIPVPLACYNGILKYQECTRDHCICFCPYIAQYDYIFLPFSCPQMQVEAKHKSVREFQRLREALYPMQSFLHTAVPNTSFTQENMHYNIIYIINTLKGKLNSY